MGLLIASILKDGTMIRQNIKVRFARHVNAGQRQTRQRPYSRHPPPNFQAVENLNGGARISVGVVRMCLKPLSSVGEVRRRYFGADFKVSAIVGVSDIAK